MSARYTGTDHRWLFVLDPDHASIIAGLLGIILILVSRLLLWCRDYIGSHRLYNSEIGTSCSSLALPDFTSFGGASYVGLFYFRARSCRVLLAVNELLRFNLSWVNLVAHCVTISSAWCVITNPCLWGLVRIYGYRAVCASHQYSSQHSCFPYIQSQTYRTKEHSYHSWN